MIDEENESKMKTNEMVNQTKLQNANRHDFSLCANFPTYSRIATQERVKYNSLVHLRREH